MEYVVKNVREDLVNELCVCVQGATKKRAGVEKANPHKFRRTCATMAMRRGMPVEQVSKMLGHESIATTQIYLDLDERELEQAHRRYVT